MIIMTYSAFTAGSIDESLGAPEYSYWFVRRAFAPVLERFGIVVPITDPKREVDAVRNSAVARGQDCVFMSFEPPHKTEIGLATRTIPVFAWEFNTVPTETWEDEPRHDWRTVLSATGSAITHSRFAVAAVKAAMGQDFPVWSIPAPVYDPNAKYAAEARGWQEPTEFTISGIAVDSAQLDADVFSMNRSFSDGLESLRALARYVEQPDRKPQKLRLHGVVYTAVFNPIDGRKNFNDVLGGFIWAFRDVDDATLILKVTYFDPVRGLQPVLADIAKHGTFRCRIILIHGMLPEDEYRALMRLTSYTVNASTNEGQCLPLMEYMSAGRPAVAPDHTAMQDYITHENAFVVRSAARPFIWPHDTRQAIRTFRHFVSVADLIRAYRESYDVAKNDPARYAAMSRAATASLREYCSIAVVERRLTEALGVPPSPPPAPDTGDARADAGTSHDPAFV